jgi:ABC-type branched-subunit amino acid transport system substrate-binding protein
VSTEPAAAHTSAGDFEKLIGALNGQSSRPANDAIEGAKLPVIRVASSKRKVTAQVRLDSFRQTTVQNFLDSGF